MRQDTTITYKWVRSVLDIPREDWDICFPGNDVLRSHPFQKSIENANMADIKFHYLLAYNNGTIICILPCFEYRHSIVGLAKGPLSRITEFIKQLFPTAFSMKLFVAGSPVAICKDLVGVNCATYQFFQSNRILQSCFKQIAQRSKVSKAGLIILKEMTSERLNSLRDLLPEKMSYAESPATTYVYTGKADKMSYSARMFSRYRNVYKKRKSNFDACGLRWVKVYDFEAYAENMYQLYSNVVDKSSTKFERLTPDFFAEVSRNLEKQSFAMLCMKQEELVAFELFLQGDELHPVYLGMNYRYRDNASLYFNCIYRIIEEAENQGLPYIELGQTSYETKAGMGALASRLYIGVMHRNPLVNKLLSKLKRYLFPETVIPSRRKIFKNGNDLLQILQREGVQVEGHS